jgi:CRP/FNR family cyclic AMP-dependent transcriptional regulator
MADSFFDRFSPREIAQICAVGTHVHVPEGWSPIWQETPADKAYVILDGAVAVRRDGHEVARLGPGDVVGETALVKHTLRTASVVALTGLDMVHFTGGEIEQLTEELPEFGNVLGEIADERIPD